MGRSAIAQIRKRSVHHSVHLVQVGDHLAPRVVLIDELCAQTHACNGRTQIVAHRRQHTRAILDHATNARLHSIQRARGSSDFIGSAILGKRQWVPIQ